MTYRIVLPGTVHGKLKTQDMILSLLAMEHPLTAKQLTNKIKKQFGSTVTFQGVYKALGQLLAEGVLEKESAGVKISVSWVRNAKGFIDGLQKKYLETGRPAQAQTIGEDVQVYAIDNLIDLDKFWIKIFEEWFESPALHDDKLVQHCGHAWYTLGHLENEEECLRNIQRHKLAFYTLVDGDTFLDKWSGKYYTQWGFHYKTKPHSTNRNHDHYYIVYGSMVMEAVYPEKLANDLDKIYMAVKRIEDLDLNKVIKILRRKEQLKITVMRNRPLANQLREGILAHWEEKKKG